METSIIIEGLNTIGLCLNFLGTILLAVFGLPQSNPDAVGYIGLGDNTTLEDGSRVGDLIWTANFFQKVKAYFGIGVLSLGFLLQIAAKLF